MLDLTLPLLEEERDALLEDEREELLEERYELPEPDDALERDDVLPPTGR